MNYDCDPYCSNLFEDITEMLTKNAYPTNRLVGTNLIALDALLAVVDAIDIQTGGSDVEEVTEKVSVTFRIVSFFFMYYLFLFFFHLVLTAELSSH